jgi:hypothetical protein
MHRRWQAGESKSQLEIEYWSDATSHGKRFTAYARRWLVVETEKRSGQSERIEPLEQLLRVHGVSSTEAEDREEHFRLVAKAREAALSALRIYNDPLAAFGPRTSSC